MVGMFEAYKLFFKNYVKFTGKSTRAEYWWVQLMNFLISLLLEIIGFALLIAFFASKTHSGMSLIFYGFAVIMLVGLYGLSTLIPSISLLFRRYRDAGVSPWWLLLTSLVPTIIAVIYNFKDVTSTIIVLIFALVNIIITILPSKNK
ncbi:DUF805 domain-containing protein [Apilactobacillus apisilvae]|uniref:DUF805 domain-containing protein n=1 Tax=Apilactobacillus apisilvae TaxID=2923364 RepID=A0ABY4PHB2_9LACO|nr:DUF805 domain-containing protein [Apilactobacillus apisilvae]UQS84876.1 DUF805 domain-containing protein [Apilactobacillus apisilvae]